MSQEQQQQKKQEIVPERYQRTDEEKAIQAFFQTRGQIENLYKQIEEKEEQIKQLEKKFPIVSNLFGQVKKRKRKAAKPAQPSVDVEMQEEESEGSQKRLRRTKEVQKKKSLTSLSAKEVRREGGEFQKKSSGQEGTGYSRSDKF